MTVNDNDYMPLPGSAEASSGDQLELFLVVVVSPGEILGIWQGGQYIGQ